MASATLLRDGAAPGPASTDAAGGGGGGVGGGGGGSDADAAADAGDGDADSGDANADADGGAPSARPVAVAAAAPTAAASPVPPLREWSVAQVGAALAAAGLGDHVDAFSTARVDGETAAALTADDLRVEFPAIPLGDRRRILALFGGAN